MRKEYQPQQRPIMVKSDITKSSRHHSIIGHFGEALTANWLSRSGWEVVLVDHTGIDIVAYHPATHQRIGITVKSRTREPIRERDSVTLNLGQEKIRAACKAFDCEPWLAVYVEVSGGADLYLLSLQIYQERYHTRSIGDYWKMGPKFKPLYDQDPEVKHIHIEFNPTNWF